MEKGKCLAFLFCLTLCFSLFQLTAELITLCIFLRIDRPLRIQLYAVSEYGHLDLNPGTTPATYARLYNMCQADWSTDVIAKLAQVKQIKPSFVRLLYANMRSATPSVWPDVCAACDTNNWWLLVGGGKVATDAGYMFDISNSAFTNWFGAYLRKRIDDVGYDGVYGDNGGPYAWGGEFFWGCTVLCPWSDAQFRQYMISYQNTVKSCLGTKLFCTNGIYSGQRYYAYQSKFDEYFVASHIDAFMSEGGWYPFWDIGANWYSEDAWVKNVNFLIHVQDSWLAGYPNRFYISMCEIGYTSLNPMPLPSGCTDQQMAKYAWASVLMGLKTNRVYLGYYREAAWITQYVLPLLNIDLGAPLNDYGMVSGTHVYARDFTNLKALVNPSTSSYTVSLGKTYNTMGGQAVTSITLPAHTGEILLNGGAVSGSLP